MNDKVLEERKKLNELIIKGLEEKGLKYIKTWVGQDEQNGISKREYHGGNKLKLSALREQNNFKDSRWVTFKQANEKGWRIKKGSKSTSIEYWSFNELKDKKGKPILNDNGKPETRAYCRIYNVFNGDQIEGIPPQESIKNDKKINEEIDLKIKKLIKSSECPIYQKEINKAFYRSSEDIITIPKSENFKSSEYELATLTHEMAHSTGHSSRLNRKLGNGFGTPDYAKEELIAEMSSIYIQKELNIDVESSLDNHKAYINSWIKALKDDPHFIYQSAKESEKATDLIINNYKQINEIELLNENIEEHKIEENKLNKEKIKDLTDLNQIKEREAFKGLKVKFYYSEHDFGIKDNTTLEGKEAYEFLNEIIKRDKKVNNMNKKGEIACSYEKTKISIDHDNIKINNGDPVRIDLGDLEFGKYKKVSKALNHRFIKSDEQINEILSNETYREVHNINSKEKEEEYKKAFNEENQKIKYITKSIEIGEKIELIQKKENSLEINKLKTSNLNEKFDFKKMEEYLKTSETNLHTIYFSNNKSLFIDKSQDQTKIELSENGKVKIPSIELQKFDEKYKAVIRNQKLKKSKTKEQGLSR